MLKLILVLTFLAGNAFASENLALTDCKHGNQEQRKIVKDKVDQKDQSNKEEKESVKSN